MAAICKHASGSQCESHAGYSPCTVHWILQCATKVAAGTTGGWKRECSDLITLMAFFFGGFIFFLMFVLGGGGLLPNALNICGIACMETLYAAASHDVCSVV